MSRPINLLITGLTMPATKRLNPQMDITAFAQTLDKSIDSLKSLSGLNYHRFDLDPEASSESAESMASFMKTVRDGPAQGGQWDAHFIGAGLKLIPSLTPLFEDLLNTIVAEGKNKPRIMFSSNAADHLEVVRRRLSELQ